MRKFFKKELTLTLSAFWGEGSEDILKLQNKRLLKAITIIVICLFLQNQLGWAYPAYYNSLRPAAAKEDKDIAKALLGDTDKEPKEVTGKAEEAISLAVADARRELAEIAYKAAIERFKELGGRINKRLSLPELNALKREIRKASKIKGLYWQNLNPEQKTRFIKMQDSTWEEIMNALEQKKKGDNRAGDAGIKFSSAGSENQEEKVDSTQAIREILQGLPDEVDSLGTLFHYVFTYESRLLLAFDTEAKKYDELCRICRQFKETDFEDERAVYIIRQAKQLEDLSMPIEIEGGKLEFKMKKGKALEGPEGIEILPANRCIL